MVASAIISGGSLANAASSNTAIISGGSVSVAAGTNTAIVSAGMLMNATVEPFSTVTLPGATPWTQTAGPATAVPTVLMPGKPSPGTTVTYKQAGTTLSFTVLPHTIFGRDSSGALFPIRRRPFLGTGTVDPGTSAPTMPTGDIVANGHAWQQIFAEDFNTDVPIGGFLPRASGAGEGGSGYLNQGGAADAPYGSKMSVYPSGFNASTYGKSRPEQVLSVSNSCLTYNFGVNTAGEYIAATVRYLIGTAAYNGAGPGYYIDPAVGGRFEIRFQVSGAPGLVGWGAVSQLIANSTDWGLRHGELDILEGSLYGYAPHGMETNFHPDRATNDGVQQWGNQDWGDNVWHTVIVEWIPVGNSIEPTGRETVWIDGVKIGESTVQVSQSYRGFFAFQTGVNSIPPPAGGIYPANGQTRGKLLVDYVVAYQPTT